MAKDAQDEAAKGKQTNHGKDDASLKVRDWALKTAGAIVGSLGLAGSMVVIGSAVLWIRFKEAGLPAIQAISAQPREEALAQGAQTTIVFVLIALALVAILYVIDARELEATHATERERRKREKAERKADSLRTQAAEPAAEPPPPAKRPADSHSMGWGPISAIATFALAGILWVALEPDLSFGAEAILAGLAILLAFGCAWMAKAESKNIWALAAAVFVAVIVFSASAGYLIVKEQKFIQAVAVLRGKQDTGLTGFYVTANGDTLYLATPVGSSGGRQDDVSIKKIDLDKSDEPESITYSVGPLESIPDAERTAEAMLSQLLEDRDGLSGTTGSLPSWLPEKKAATFAGKITAKEEVSGEPLCLMRYAATNQKDKKRSFWTSCPEAEAQATIDDARERFALPGRFQKDYKIRVKVEVPVGTKLRYAEGATAPQCGGEPGGACGRRYPGGGLQYWVKKPSQLGEITLECPHALPDQESKWKPWKQGESCKPPDRPKQAERHPRPQGH